MNNEVWIPQHKYELVKWLTHYYGINRYKGWSKARLYACYFETRKTITRG